jgi:hypothetical protein
MALAVAQLVASRELMHDARTIMRMGPGLYELDLLTHRLKHSMRYFPELHIANMLRSRIRGAFSDLDREGEELSRATINMQARLDERDPAKGYRPMMEFGRYTGVYILCRLQIQVMLATATAEYPAQHNGQVDWPRDWDKLGL